MDLSITILIRGIYMSDGYKILNEKKLTNEEFEEEKKKLEENNKGVKVIRIKENEYKTRIQE